MCKPHLTLALLLSLHIGWYAEMSATAEIANPFKLAILIAECHRRP